MDKQSDSGEPEDKPEVERVRRSRGISLSEPSLRDKMRQGSTSVYSDFVPLKGKKSKK
jgi:hypothetical protein